MSATSSIVVDCIVIGAMLWVVPFAPRAAEPLLHGLGTHTRKVTTPSRNAQKYFDQGLRFYFGFNHGAAVRSFREAARLDPISISYAGLKSEPG
jgi:hypothetical protein